jgi:hypothetical protein
MRDSWKPADKAAEAEIDDPTEFPREPRNVERERGPILPRDNAATGKTPPRRDGRRT